MNNQLIVGASVWVKEIYTNRGKNGYLIETKIKSIGKKYFELEENFYGRFLKNTLLQDGKSFSPRYKVYLDKRHFEDEKEHALLSSKIREKIGNYGPIALPLKTLRKIDLLITENQTTCNTY